MLVSAILKEEGLINTEVELTDVLAAVGGNLFESDLKIKMGFPPKAISASTALTSDLSELKFKSSDNCIVEVSEKLLHWRNSSGSAAAGDGSSERVATKNGFTVLKVNSDGSCLFNSITQAIERTDQKSMEMRSAIAAFIFQEPDRYNKKFLGGALEPEAYAEWICKPNEWGGIPELRLLSKYYSTQINVVDIGEDVIIEFKGDDGTAKFDSEIYLLFDGSHYNLAVQGLVESDSKRTFKVGEAGVREEMRELGRLIKASGQWIDVNLFALKCGDCGKALEGQFEAIEHAKTTGHQNFTQLERPQFQ